MSIPDSGILPYRDTHSVVTKPPPAGGFQVKDTHLSHVLYLIDESTHPQAGRDHEQSVREEDEVAFV